MIVACYLAIEGLVWKFGELYRDVHPSRDLLAVGLRNRDEDAHNVDSGETD